MIVTAYNEQIQCTKAIKGDDYIRLLDAQGNCIASFDGISDFWGYSVNGGEWDGPEPTVEQQLNALKSLVAGPEPVTLADYKTAKVATSKAHLADYLAAHPLTYADGKQYSVTAEKQSLLTSALARHQIATAAGVQTALKWNATGEECTEWAYADLAALALAIAAYVEPLVAQQQAVEVAINACTTIDAVKAITIAYGA